MLLKWNLAFLLLTVTSIQGVEQLFEDADYDAEVDVHVEDTLVHTVNVVAPPAYHDEIYVNIKPNSIVGFLQTPDSYKVGLSRKSKDFNVEVDKSNIHTLKVTVSDAETGDAVAADIPAVEAQVPAEEGNEQLVKLGQDSVTSKPILAEEPTDIVIPSVPYPSFPALPVFTPPNYNDFLGSTANHADSISTHAEKLEEVDPSAYVLNFYLGF